MPKTPQNTPQPPNPPSSAVPDIGKADLSQSDKQQIAIHMAQFQGPLPHPDHLQKYESVLPGAADRILTITEDSVDHDINMERLALDAEIRARDAEVHARDTDAKESRQGLYCGTGLFAMLITAAFAALLVSNAPLRAAALFLSTAAIGSTVAIIKLTRRK